MKKTNLRVSKNEMKHSSRGIFAYRNRKPIQMLKGGHGQRNVDYLKKHRLAFGIDEILRNGVRYGHIQNHKRSNERKNRGHAWFPEKWSDVTIKNAGEHVANLKNNRKMKNHVPMHGRYKGVDVVTYKVIPRTGPCSTGCI